MAGWLTGWLAGWLWAEHRHERARGETKRKRRNAGGRSTCLGLARARQCEKDTRERESWIWDTYTYMCKSLCLGTRGAPAGYGDLERARRTSDYLPYQRKWLEVRGERRETGSRAAGCSCRMFWKESVDVTGTVSAICETRMVYGMVWHVTGACPMTECSTSGSGARASDSKVRACACASR